MTLPPLELLFVGVKLPVSVMTPETGVTPFKAEQCEPPLGVVVLMFSQMVRSYWTGCVFDAPTPIVIASAPPVAPSEATNAHAFAFPVPPLAEQRFAHVAPSVSVIDTVLLARAETKITATELAGIGSVLTMNARPAIPFPVGLVDEAIC